MGRRKEQRVKGILPVRVTGSDTNGKAFATLAHTVDVSRSGIRLAGPFPELAIATRLWVQFHRQRACFEVVRFTRNGRSAEVGLSLRSAENISWGADFDPSFIDAHAEAVERK